MSQYVPFGPLFLRRDRKKMAQGPGKLIDFSVVSSSVIFSSVKWRIFCLLKGYSVVELYTVIELMSPEN